MSHVHGPRWRVAALLACLALAAAACSGGDTSDDGTTDDETSAEDEPDSDDDPEAAGPETVTIQIDGQIGDSNSAILGYLPREATVRAGDTVDFALAPGDPHTVTLGSLVDAAFAAMAEAEEDGPPPPEVAAIPQALTEELETIGAGILPCFSDDPPTDGPPCEEVEQPAFTGELGFYNSGVLGEPGSSFTVQVAEDATPGTYNYFCLIHGPDMSGTLTIVGADEDAPGADAIQAQREETLETITAETTPVLEATSQGTQPGFEDAYGEGDATVLGGGGAEPAGFIVDILQFGPEEVEVAAGGTVRWNMFGFHTISFSATQDATPFIIPGDEGPMVNPLAIAPQGGANPMPPPDGSAPPEGPPEATVIDGGEWDGQGFFSSGLLVSFPPALASYDITFTTEGTYTYQCLVHPGMEGTVNVTG